MKIGPIVASSMVMPSVDDDPIPVERVLDELVSAIKEHGHYGNVLHHDSGGDWRSVADALRNILWTRQDVDTMTPVGRDLIRMLGGSGPRNIREFRSWFLERLQGCTTGLFREVATRRIDELEAQRSAVCVKFRSSALRTLAR